MHFPIAGKLYFYLPYNLLRNLFYACKTVIVKSLQETLLFFLTHNRFKELQKEVQFSEILLDDTIQDVFFKYYHCLLYIFRIYSKILYFYKIKLFISFRDKSEIIFVRAYVKENK